MKKVLYIYPKISTFIQQDIDLLSASVKVISSDDDWTKRSNVVKLFFKQFIFLLKHIHSCKAVFVMFGGYWSLLPAIAGYLFNRPVFIILGGMDCVSFPHLNYGSLRKPILKTIIEWSYKLATRLLPVHESLVDAAYTYDERSHYPRQGYQYLLPSVKTPFTTIYNGYNVFFWKKLNETKLRNTFVMVAGISNEQRFMLKGGDIFVALAKTFGHCSFTIVGMSTGFRQQLGALPQNLVICDFLSTDQLRSLLAQSEFYAQLSVSEGFPNSLCEAMLMECIPIGSCAGGIPLIVGDTGVVVQKRNIDLIISEVQAVLNLSDEERKDLSMRSRKRIVENFPMEKRQQSLLHMLNITCKT